MFQIEAAYAVGAAENGDFAPIITRLENPEIRLEQIERQFLADHLKPRQKGRPPKDGGWLVARVQCLHRWLIAVEKWQKEPALLEIERVLPVGKGTPRNYLSKELVGMPALWATVTLKEVERAAKGDLSEQEFEHLRANLGIPTKK
jgi:hypothetical protein